MAGRDNPDKNSRMLLTDFSPRTLRNRFAGDPAGSMPASILDLADSLGLDFEEDPGRESDMPPAGTASGTTRRRIDSAVGGDGESPKTEGTGHIGGVRDGENAPPVRPPLDDDLIPPSDLPPRPSDSRRGSPDSLRAEEEVPLPPGPIPDDDDINRLLERAFGNLAGKPPLPRHAAQSGGSVPDFPDLYALDGDGETDIFALLSGASELAPGHVKAAHPVYGGLKRVEDWYEPPPETEREKAAREQRNDWYDPPDPERRDRRRKPAPSPQTMAESEGIPENGPAGGDDTRQLSIPSLAPGLPGLAEPDSLSAEDGPRTASGQKNDSTRLFAGILSGEEGLPKTEMPYAGETRRPESGKKNDSTRLYADSAASVPGTECLPETEAPDIRRPESAASSRRFSGFDSFDIDSLWKERVHRRTAQGGPADDGSRATPESHKNSTRLFGGFDSFDVDSLWKERGGRNPRSRTAQNRLDSSNTVHQKREEEGETIRRVRRPDPGGGDTTAIWNRDGFPSFFDPPAGEPRKKKKPGSGKKPKQAPAANPDELAFLNDPEDAGEEETGGEAPSAGELSPEKPDPVTDGVAPVAESGTGNSPELPLGLGETPPVEAGKESKETSETASAAEISGRGPEEVPVVEAESDLPTGDQNDSEIGEVFDSPVSIGGESPHTPSSGPGEEDTHDEEEETEAERKKDG
ncbi:MAG: hypothetical protein LBE84_08725, partial [Planctomycetota bacterium]|nr:hypothetical protein [Planctomycetota bacterium]